MVWADRQWWINTTIRNSKKNTDKEGRRKKMYRHVPPDIRIEKVRKEQSDINRKRRG